MTSNEGPLTRRVFSKRPPNSRRRSTSCYNFNRDKKATKPKSTATSHFHHLLLLMCTFAGIIDKPSRLLSQLMLPKLRVHKAASKTHQKPAPQQWVSPLAASIIPYARTVRRDRGHLYIATAHEIRKIDQELE